MLGYFGHNVTPYTPLFANAIFFYKHFKISALETSQMSFGNLGIPAPFNFKKFIYALKALQ